VVNDVEVGARVASLNAARSVPIEPRKVATATTPAEQLRAEAEVDKMFAKMEIEIAHRKNSEVNEEGDETMGESADDNDWEFVMAEGP